MSIFPMGLRHSHPQGERREIKKEFNRIHPHPDPLLQSGEGIDKRKFLKLGFFWG
jgi:hypothetical protein